MQRKNKEVTVEGRRYILRCNNEIRKKLRHDRENRIAKIQKKIDIRNEFVATHPKSDIEGGMKNIEKNESTVTGCLKRRLTNSPVSYVRSIYPIMPTCGSKHKSLPINQISEYRV